MKIHHTRHVVGLVRIAPQDGMNNAAEGSALGSAATVEPASPPDRLWRPPGVPFYAAVAFAVLMALWLSSLRSEVGQWATALVWLAVAGLWVVRVVGSAKGRRRFSRAEWIRWLAIPASFGLAGVIVWSGAPFAVRLALSQAGMDQAAGEVTAGDTTERQWIGLWAVDDVERIPGGMRFIVASGDSAERWGFAYSETGGRPAIMDGSDTYEHLDGSWWIWTDGAPDGPQGRVAAPQAGPAEVASIRTEGPRLDRTR
jgi:hypothetical protein